MAKKLTKAHLSITLADVVEQTLEEKFMFTPEQLHKEWVAKGLVEVNSTDVPPDEYGCIATRATQAGIDFVNSENATPTSSADDFEIEDGIAMPSRTSAGRKSAPEQYPFSKLGKGQSFLVRGVDMKAMRSHVAKANKAFTVIVPGETKLNRKGAEVKATKAERKFVAREVAEGVRVWREA